MLNESTITAEELMTRNGKLVGIVARSDLVRALAQKLGEKAPSLPERRSVDESLRHGRKGTAP